MQSDTSNGLDSLRKQIDAVDREIVERLNARVRLASQIGKVKLREGAEIYQPNREEEIYRKLAGINPGPLPEGALRAIYREIISASISLQKPVTIAYLGPEATYTHQAALKNFGSSLPMQPMTSITDVFAAVESGEADYGVVPIENSTEGAINQTVDLLVESDLKVVAQVYLPIEHCLISKSPLSEIRRVLSKDTALAQCREWLRRNVPKAELVAFDSTAAAVRMARDNADVAAVAGCLAAEQYGVPVVFQGIQDRADNITRFFVLGRKPTAPLGKGADKTSIVISIHDKPGALQSALSPFSSRGINMTKIESRPSRRKLWDYYFFIDFVGHWQDAVVQEAVAEISASCPFVKWLGSYPNGQP